MFSLQELRRIHQALYYGAQDRSTLAQAHECTPYGKPTRPMRGYAKVHREALAQVKAFDRIREKVAAEIRKRKGQK